MTGKLCLRCDWQGATDAARCPECGEPLYRPPRAASTARGAPSGVPPRQSSPRPDLVEPPFEPTEPVHRSRSLVAFVAVAVVLAAAVGSWLDAHGAPAPAVGPVAPMRLEGTLVYAVPDGPGQSRLWRWDPATGVVRRGPRVARAIALVDSSGAHAGWVGVTSELPDGRLRGSVLRSLDPGTRPRPILAGDLLSWGARGNSLVAARRSELAPGCRRRVAIVWAGVVPAFRERRYADHALCGDVLSVGLGDVSTYFTLERRGRIGVYLAGYRRIHRLLVGRALVAVSSLDDMLVVPAASLHGEPVAERPEQGMSDLPGTGLFFQGQRPTPVTSYGVGGERFAIERVLAWSPDALTALVVGRLGDRRGVYELDAGPAVGQRVPRYVGTAAGYPYATWTSYGVAILQTRDGLFVLTPRASVRMPAPADAPAPLGPMVWIR